MWVNPFIIKQKIALTEMIPYQKLKKSKYSANVSGSPFIFSIIVIIIINDSPFSLFGRAFKDLLIAIWTSEPRFEESDIYLVSGK